MLSFYAPYRCDACNTSFQALIDAYVHRDAIVRKVAPTLPCPKCGKSAFYDGEPQAFAKAAAQVEPPPASAMQEFDPKGARLDRNVSGGTTRLVLVGELTSSARWRNALDGVDGDLVIDLSRTTTIALGGVNPLISALRIASAKSIALHGAPRQVAESLRAGPIPNLSLVSVYVDGNCKKCGVPRRALMEVVEGSYETTLVRAVVCPHCKGPLSIGRTEDVPQRNIPFGFILGLSGILAVVGVVVVVVGIVMAGLGGPPKPDDGMPKSAVNVEGRLDIGAQTASASGNAGPYATLSEAETIARDKALMALVTALAKEIATRRGLEGGVAVGPADAKRVAELVAPDLTELQLASDVTEGPDGYTVSVKYGMPRAQFDHLVADYAEERRWGGMKLVKPFPPAAGLRVVDSEVAGIEPGMRIARIGPDEAAMGTLPPPTPGLVLVVQDPDGTEQTFALP